MNEVKTISLTSGAFQDCLAGTSDHHSEKKHDITLNLNKSEKTSKYIADQTPTPTTRLIRNCEEFGLFDDLKHNPFEETFRQAIGGESKSANASLSNQKSLELIKCNDEDTLHTPILCKYTSSNVVKEKKTTNESKGEKSSTVSLVESSEEPKNPENSTGITKQKTFRKIHPKPVIVSTICSISPIKEKIRQSLLKCQTIHSDKNTTVGNAPMVYANVEHKRKATRTKNEKKTRDYSANERNREAAKRYRSKQKILHNKLLKRNAQLEAEVIQLRNQLEAFEKAHEKCSVTSI